MNFLDIKGKNFLITGIANKKSVAYHVAKSLQEEEANILLLVQNETNFSNAKKLFPNVPIYICDIENQDEINTFIKQLKSDIDVLHGFLHSIAYANFEDGFKPFHETSKDNFMQAMNISCFSLVSLSNELKDILDKNASVVTISISNTRATSYGYLGPIKATLDATVAYLAKSFSEFSNIRFNALCAGPLKTSASAGIPNYIDNYLFSEALTLRKKSLKTDEVSNTALFLLSNRSSGINASNLIVDAGISANHFDSDVVKIYNKNKF